MWAKARVCRPLLWLLWAQRIIYSPTVHLNTWADKCSRRKNCKWLQLSQFHMSVFILLFPWVEFSTLICLNKCHPLDIRIYLSVKLLVMHISAVQSMNTGTRDVRARSLLSLFSSFQVLGWRPLTRIANSFCRTTTQKTLHLNICALALTLIVSSTVLT